MKIFRFFNIFTLSLFPLLLLSSCSTLNKDECINADWYQIGFEDGTRGSPVKRLSRHRSACAEHGITVNIKQYRTGRDEGLTLYCVPHKALALGKSGNSYKGICSQHNEAAFLKAYQYGHHLYDLQQHIKKNEKTLSEMEHEYDHLTKDIKEAEQKIITEKSTPEKREALLKKVKRLTNKRFMLRSAMSNLHLELTALKDDYREASRREVIQTYLH